MPSAFKQTCICRKAKRKRVGESGWEGEGWVGGLTLGRGDRESFFHTQLSWDRMGLPAQGQKKDDGKKRFCCRSFPYVVSRMGGENVSSDFVMAQKKNKKHKLDEEENFAISNHQKFMRHKMRQKTEGVALSLLGGWTADDGGGHRRKIK